MRSLMLAQLEVSGTESFSDVFGAERPPVCEAGGIKAEEAGWRRCDGCLPIRIPREAS